jgi:hypothetical protein
VKVFVSGPMTGYEHYNFAAFQAAEAELADVGLTPVSLRQVVEMVDEGKVTRTNEEYMRWAVDLLRECDALTLLRNWERSDNARFEAHLAQKLGKPIVDTRGRRLPPPALFTALEAPR